MRKFFLHIALFGLPFVGLLAWLLLEAPDKAYSYKMIQKDCRTGAWTYRRLFEEPAPVDVAFVGTSKTMCDVNDSLLEHRLLMEHGLKMHIANFGVCRLGENLHSLFTRDIFAQKNPRFLIVEVSTNLATNSHFHFPYLGTASDVIGAPMWANSDYLYDVVQLCWNRLVYHREHVLGIDRSFEEILHDSLHSFLVVRGDMVADSTEMARTKEKRQIRLTQDLPGGIQRWIYNAEARPAKIYLENMAATAKAGGAQVIFLYLPVYGANAPLPQEAEFLQSMGPVWVPPDSIFKNPRLHMDNSHLNQKGARKLSDWLVDQLVSLGK